MVDGYFNNNFMIFLSTLPTVIVSGLLKLLGIAVVWFVGTKIIAFIRKVLWRAMDKGNADKSVASFLDNFVKIAAYVLLAFVILGMFGVQPASIAAVVASAGVAIGLALQGSLSNLAGGVLILLLRPFNVGDYIIASGLEGTVTNIQMFYTKLLTGDNRLVVLPNGSLSNNNIINVSAEPVRRIDINVGISYDSDIKTAKNVLFQMLEESAFVLKDMEYKVVVSELADSSVNLIIRFWVKKEDYWNAKFALTETTKLLLDEKGIEIPFNQIDVNIKGQS